MKFIYPKLYTLLLVTFFALLCHTNTAAAEKVVFKYGIFRPSLPVSELTNLVETGEVSPRLNFFLKQARQEPQKVREVLAWEINVSPVVLDRALNNPAGEFLLDRISWSIHTPSNQENQQALRSALVLSAKNDNKVSLIEMLQNYPTTEVDVEGERLVQTYDQLKLWAERVQKTFHVPVSLN